MGALVGVSKLLRKKSTNTENDLWYYLRSRHLKGLKFRRQHILGAYIVDFVCLEKRIVIELDGSQHIECANKDSERDEWLKSEGYKVLRFWNNEFYENREGVLSKILEASE
ncbi:MAG: endonuclease domain-containing protein [Deltaproteobacteria bacterium]|nr:endonuclease domain-containing protein [Deltaproteobacteria bacterium]